MKKPEGFFSFVRVKFNAILYAVLTILLDEISLPKVYERDFIKNEKKTEFLTTSNVKAVCPPRFFILRQKDSTKVRIRKNKR